MERLLAISIDFVFKENNLSDGMKWTFFSWYGSSDVIQAKDMFWTEVFFLAEIFAETIEQFTMFNHYITYILCHLLHMKQIVLFNMLMVYCVMSNRQSAVLSGCGIKAAILSWKNYEKVKEFLLRRLSYLSWKFLKWD